MGENEKWKKMGESEKNGGKQKVEENGRNWVTKEKMGKT